MKKFAIVALFLTLCTSVFAQTPSKIVIAVQPTASASTLSDKAKEMEAVLEKELGRDVEILFPTSYAGVIEALRFGHAQAAFLGAWPAQLAVDKAGAYVALAEIREVLIDHEKKQEPYYFSYWVVAKSSPYQKLEDLKGKTASFPNPLSTSGYVAPLAHLIEKGLVSKPDKAPADPKTFFGNTLFSGGYAQSYQALKNGQADATIIAGDVPEALYREVLDGTRVIDQQGPVPSHVVVFSKDLSASDASALKKALMVFNDANRRPLMRKFISGIFVAFKEAGEEHLASLKSMLETTGLEYVEKK